MVNRAGEQCCCAPLDSKYIHSFFSLNNSMGQLSPSIYFHLIFTFPFPCLHPLFLLFSSRFVTYYGAVFFTGTKYRLVINRRLIFLQSVISRPSVTSATESAALSASIRRREWVTAATDTSVPSAASAAPYVRVSAIALNGNFADLSKVTHYTCYDAGRGQLTSLSTCRVIVFGLTLQIICLWSPKNRTPAFVSYVCVFCCSILVPVLLHF